MSAEPAMSGGVKGPLAGLVVLDLTRFYSGPFATLLLAGMGADVIRIDPPGKGDPTMSGPPFLGPDGAGLQRRSPDDIGLAYLKRGRGKRAITLDIKTEEGLGIFRDLLARADVLVENFRPGVAARLGIGYETNAHINPRLVHCAITGYGTTGPDCNLKAYDLTIQAASGLMSITGDPDGIPRKAGSAMADGISGAFAVSAMLAAVISAKATGLGQFVDVSMADCLTTLVMDEPLDCYAQFGLQTRQGNRIMRFSPFNTYPTRDGMVVIGCATDADWRVLLGVMGLGARADEPEMMNTGWRVAHNDEMDAIVGAWSVTRSTADILAELEKHEIACSPVRDFNDLAQWEHLRARDMLAPVPHPTATPATPALAAGFPFKFAGTPGGYATPAPTLGQHNDSVFRDLLDLSSGEIADLRARKII